MTSALKLRTSNLRLSSTCTVLLAVISGAPPLLTVIVLVIESGASLLTENLIGISNSSPGETLMPNPSGNVQTTGSARGQGNTIRASISLPPGRESTTVTSSPLAVSPMFFTW